MDDETFKRLFEENDIIKFKGFTMNPTVVTPKTAYEVQILQQLMAESMKPGAVLRVDAERVKEKVIDRMFGPPDPTASPAADASILAAYDEAAG